MKKALISAFAATSLFYGVGQAQASSIVIPSPLTSSDVFYNIDSFATGDQGDTLIGPAPKGTTSTGSGSEILGGSREIKFDLTQAASNKRKASFSADGTGETSLILNNDDQVKSDLTSSYKNLGGLDFATKGGNKFVFDLISADLGFNFSLTVNGKTVSGPLPPVTSPTTFSIPFSAPEFAGVDFTSINDISFTISATEQSADISIDNFGYAGPAIPEPMTMSGLALGALGLIKFKSSKKQKQA